MNQTSFDVVVVGAGPAGSLTAYLLAKAGVRVAVIDSSTFPRSKPCGGGLQARALRDIPFDVGHLFRGAVNRLSLSFCLTDRCTRLYPEPLVFNVLRSEFDFYLLQEAERAGAKVYEATRLLDLEIHDRGPLSARTQSGELECQFVVGADGANSVVRGFLNTRHAYFWQAAMYCEFPEELANPSAYEKDCIMVDWGTLPSGYAWVFPKQGYINIGAGGPLGIARYLRRYIAKFISSTKMLRLGSSQMVNLVGHQLPTLTDSVRVASGRVLLVGDAAGLVEPFTGDGIAFACRSAHLASASIYRCLNDQSMDLAGYGSQIRSLLYDELLWAGKLLSVSAAFPRLIYDVFKNNDRIWRTFCRTLRGEETFHKLKKDILGPFEFAWRAVDIVSRLRENSALGPRALARHLQGLIS